MDRQEAKRVRQACRNCRRKKTRCSGQQPVCTFCARLCQKCIYDDIAPSATDNTNSNLRLTRGQVSPTSSGAEAVLVMESSLINRIAIIESKLAVFKNSLMGSRAQKTPSTVPWPSSFSSSSRISDQASGQENNGRNDDADELLSTGVEASRFITLPPNPVVMSLTETYFRYCHCQPYAYFREQTFRQRLLDNALPGWLVLALIATASLFSDDAFFQGRQEEAMESFADVAWREIHEKVFSEDGFLSHHVVQATSMLAVLDFTAGRNNRGWMKVGLAIRFAQALNLSAEPDPTLPVWLQDEHRGTFWSVYLLDRFVSCGPQRTPTIQDADCTIKLGLDPAHYDGTSGPALITMGDLVATPGSAAEVGQAGYLCLMASTLGRIQKYCLRSSDKQCMYPPWDSRSEFASIRTALMTFEAYSPLVWGDFDQARIQLSPTQEVLGFICFSYVLYFTNRCLLLHPFLFQQSIVSWGGPVPRSFLCGLLQESHESATKCTDLLQHLLKARLCLTSFLGYCAVTAGVIHRLFQQHHDPSIQASSRGSYERTLQFLRDAPACGQHFSRMRQALVDFDPDPEATAALVNPSLLAGMPLHPDAGKMWMLLDYGWLSGQAKNEVAPLSQTTTQVEINLSDWPFTAEPENAVQAWCGLNLSLEADVAEMIGSHS